MLKCIPSQSDHLGMMINGRVKYLSHRTSYWAAAAMWVAVTPSVIAARTPWKKQKKKTGEELSWVSSASYFSCDFFFFFFLCSSVFTPLWKASCSSAEALPRETYTHENAGARSWGRAAHLVGIRDDARDSCVSVIVESINYWTWQEINRSSKVIPFPTGSILRQ